MAIDAEHCRAVNDTYSYRVRVSVLRHLAAVITAASRTMDFVARFGGEAFVMLLPSTNLAAAEVVARSLITSVATQVVEVGKKPGSLHRRCRSGADGFRPQRHRLLV